MGAGWVAGATRAKAMASARVGAEGARELSAAATLPDALRGLRGTPYRRDLDPRAGLAAAQRAVSAAALWRLRVLAGWQPRAGVAALRLLCSDYEIANTEEHLRALTGGEQPRPYRLGALATAWRRLAATTTPDRLRAALAGSAWGDPGAATPAAVATGMRLSAADRLASGVPQAALWAAGRAALLVARETFLLGRRPEPPAAGRAARLLGRPALDAGTYEEFRDRLPAPARWALEGAAGPRELWRCEARWWARVERDSLEALRRTRFDSSPVVAAAALMSADAWRVRAALEAAAHGGRAREAFDAVLD
ncbi:V-type ATPase subunit [Streptomyces sp. GC420]|uniref:V-type ATPase subunit n=1 Tax=Streptomyces sp. GC420 TaxID=2697568 RepID=UPI0014151DA0|nr:V-type ATPase subunit [Streptomyces sp. GC420]NBM20242.1 hypothetical protein [Streptomyces sp. GC420]